MMRMPPHADSTILAVTSAMAIFSGCSSMPLTDVAERLGLGVGGARHNNSSESPKGTGGVWNGWDDGAGGKASSGGSKSDDPDQEVGGASAGGGRNPSIGNGGRSSGGSSKGGARDSGNGGSRVGAGGANGEAGGPSGGDQRAGSRAVGGNWPGSSRGGIANTGGSTGTGPVATTMDCGLPSLGSSKVAKPSGSGTSVTVLNWAGFKGAVTYTFDDANSSQISHYSELNALGVPMTFYLQTGKSDASNAIWGTAVKDGHELGNHTQSHQQSGSANDVDAATTFIESVFGVKAYTMAAPYGDTSYSALAKSRFIINRGVADALIAPKGNSDPFNLSCHIPPTGATASALNAKVDAAHSAGAWQVVLVHGFTGGSDGAYQPISITEFTSSVNHAKSLGDMWIDSMVNIGAYWLAQKAFPSSPTTSGGEKTWTWSLPEHFPPGKCLRVTTDGGTLKQKSGTLAWDSHGYYEVSLDDGSLTLAP